MKKKIILASSYIIGNATTMAQEALSNHYDTEVQRGVIIDTLGSGYIDMDFDFADKPEYKYFEKPKSKYHK